MKKIGKYLILVAVLGALLCVSAFAADELTVNNFQADAVEVNDNGVSFTASYAAGEDAAGDQYLILMLKGEAVTTEPTKMPDPTEGNILYINQTAADSNGNVAFDNVYPSSVADSVIFLVSNNGAVALASIDVPTPDVSVEIVGASNPAQTEVSGTTLTVQCDQACVVVYTTDGGETYQTLEATENANGGYDFDLSQLPDGAQVSVALKGDANGDGKVNNTDYAIIKKMLLKDDDLSGLQAVMFDVNGDGKINNTDYAILKKHLLDTSKNLVTW